jgi:spermidine synthase
MRSVPGKALFDEVRKGAGVIEKSRWNSLGRLDLFRRNDYPAKFFYTDAAVPATMFQYSGNREQMAAYLRRFICFAPFTCGPVEKVLSIGSGGGMDCLISRLGGAGEITAVEINGEMVKMAREEAAYNGGVLDMPGVRTVVDEGRCFVRASRDAYDLILLLLTQGNNAEAGGRVLTENYLMTQEAFGEYYDRLRPGGRLVVAVHNPHRASRYLMTWAEMLRERGVDLSGAVRRFAMLSYPDAAYRFLCVFHREILSPENGRILKAFADSCGGDLHPLRARGGPRSGRHGQRGRVRGGLHPHLAEQHQHRARAG